MQLILLSGGSGKRLWPLSNDIRSKQFLPLLASPKGGRESMIQRVARQIRSSMNDVEITFATNEAQRNLIINQLGNDVSIVVEPERRNTFPAIALAVSFLSTCKRCPDDEVVVVMPCDVYAEPGYFDTIASMEKAVLNNDAELVLMGIKPTYPSEKFGYILPSSEQYAAFSFNVSGFTEKPDCEKAKVLLSEGACWNGGVFAFRAGYLMDIVKKYVSAESFDEVLAHYIDFPKISFDYEVVEKAKSVAFVPYDGKWKDLGTWNTLCEELPSTHIGNAYWGESNQNTHVINELSLPVFCNGLKDMIVAASPDGIMVCAKDKTEGIKDYVSEFSTRPMYEEMRWGSSRVIDIATFPDGTQSMTKSITVKAGNNICYQSHCFRNEVLTILNGKGEIVVDDDVRTIDSGNVVDIPAGHKHAIRAVTDLFLIEVQTGTSLIDDDVECFEWNW